MEKTEQIPSSENDHSDTIKKILFPVSSDCSFYESVELYEKTIMKKALERHKTLKEAIEALQMPRSSFMDKKKRFNL